MGGNPRLQHRIAHGLENTGILGPRQPANIDGDQNIGR